MVSASVMRRWYIACCGVCFGMLYLYSLSSSDRNDPADFLPVVLKLVTSKSAEEFIERNKIVQKKRDETIRNVCRHTSAFGTSNDNGHSNSTYYFSSTYNFTFCKVPKCGSTVWTQAFEILNNGIERADEVFTRSRELVHFGFERTSNMLAKYHLKRTPVVFVARDPYSRLFSAYIDKIYLLQLLHIHIDIQNLRNESQRKVCQFNVSFEMFLEYVVSNAFAGKTLNKHWAPITSLCKPCEYTELLLVKLETFSNDVEYVLKVFNVDKNEAAILLDSIHGQRIQRTIPSMVKTIYNYSIHSIAIKCFGYHGIAERIWRSFQIQGYLDDTVPFPGHIHKGDLENASHLSERILDVIAMHPMSREAQKSQRRAALVDAYRRVSKHTIKKIQQVYKLDFAMFDYSEKPPLFR